MALTDVTMRELLIFEACDEAEKLHLARIAELEADLNQARTALVEIREKAPAMTNGGDWAAGLATLCVGNLKSKL